MYYGKLYDPNYLLKLCNDICSDDLPDEIENPDPELEGIVGVYVSQFLDEYDSALVFRYDASTDRLYLEICGSGDVVLKSTYVSGRTKFNVLKLKETSEDLIDGFGIDIDNQETFEKNTNYHFPDTIIVESSYTDYDDGVRHIKQRKYVLDDGPFIPPYGDDTMAYADYMISEQSIDGGEFVSVNPSDFGNMARIQLTTNDRVSYEYQRTNFFSKQEETVDFCIGYLDGNKVIAQF